MFHFDFESLLTGSGALIGLIIIGAIIFAESGLLVGFFLPGDTLLLFAGFFAAQGKLPLGWLLLTVVVCAIVGDNVGYSIGHKTGPKIFKKKEGLFFHKDHIKRAEAFYNDHGGKTIILARFIPVVRTFAPIVAGVGNMPRRRFMAFNVVGAFIWGVGVTLLGYFLGGFVAPETVEKFILPVILSVTLGTFGPALYHLLKEKPARQAIVKRIKLAFSKILLNKKID